MKTLVGIEALAVAVPRRYVDLEDLARARGVDPQKYTQGLGGKRMAIPDPGEDTVALAATAARRLLTTSGVDPKRIGMLVVGTETGVDHSKPVASHVQGLLHLPRTMRVYDTQHACYGGTAALMACTEWIASGAADGRVGVVVTSDIARYGLNTAGEPTQGAAAVAMLVSADPQLLALDFGLNGTSSTDVYDFWRPLGHREAMVDGHYSIGCYLDAVAEAYQGWRTRAEAREVIRSGAAGLSSEQLARIVYHVPFCKMAKKAHAHLRRMELAAGGTLSPEAEEREKAAGAASFERQVASTLELCADVGNAYTGSMYLGLAGLMQKQAEALAGERLGLFSYGSGCCGEFYSGVVGRGAAAAIARADLPDMLARRERVDIAEYERLLQLPYDAPQDEKPMPGAFRFTGVRDGKRSYTAG